MLRSAALAILLLIASAASRAQLQEAGHVSGKPLVTHIYTADAAAHVFDGKLCVYVSHDTGAVGTDGYGRPRYDLRDIHLLRLDTAAPPARDLGSVLPTASVPWASGGVSAGDVAENDGRYYLYFPARDHAGIFRIGVASAAAPEGPFIPEPQPIGGSFGTSPAVFRDDDAACYLYFGATDGGQLGFWNRGVYDSCDPGPADDQPAPGPFVARLAPGMKSFREAPRRVVINDSLGYPLRGGDRARRFGGGTWVHKFRDRYYLSYATADSHRLDYATSRNPYGPFTWRGVLLPPVEGRTTHPSIVSYSGRWYLFYHERGLPGTNSLRNVKMRELSYDQLGRIRLAPAESAVQTDTR